MEILLRPKQEAVMHRYKAKAAAIGVEIRPSRREDKKFDAYKDGVFQASFGGKGYKDYEVYKKEGQELARKKRRAYKARHEHDRHIKMRAGKLTAGYLADKILW